MLSLTILFLFLATAQDTLADEPQEALDAVVESSKELVPAKQLERSPPKYPSLELRNEREGWVHVTYCIDESGTPQNVSVLDSVGGPRFDEAAIESVKSWKFEPALVDDQPSWQSRNQTYITFALEGDNKGASGRFISKFRKINKLIEQEKLHEADELFWDLYENYDLNLYELSKLWGQRVRYEGLGGDMYKLDMALHRATASNGRWTDKESYVQLLALRTRVELQIGQYHAALSAYRRLTDATGKDSKEVQDLKPVMKRLVEMIEGDSILKISAEVRSKGECNNCDDSWNFTPVRDVFSFANVAGNLESIEMRCDHKRFESAVAEAVEWHIPDDWGTCHVQVYGEPGTTFDVLMLPTT